MPLIPILRAMENGKNGEFILGRVQFVHDDVGQPFHDPFTRARGSASVANAGELR